MFSQMVVISECNVGGVFVIFRILSSQAENRNPRLGIQYSLAAVVDCLFLLR
jgi:hypothetical protein